MPDSSTSKLTPLLVRLDHFTTLHEAHDYLISCPKMETPARIVPLWDGGTTLSFLVVLGKSFQEEEEARVALADLDDRLRATATILQELGGTPL